MSTPTPDARPWESLKQGDPLHAGDEVRQEWYGVTRGGIVGRVDGNGDPWTAEGGYIGPILGGIWYVRRPVQELPTEDGEIIIPADGHEHVEAVVYGHTYYANAAMLVNGNWQAAWGTAIGWAAPISSMTPESITPGTWKAVGE